MVLDGFLDRRIPGFRMEMEVTPRNLAGATRGRTSRKSRTSSLRIDSVPRTARRFAMEPGKGKGEGAKNQDVAVEWSGVEWSGVEWSGVEWSGVSLAAYPLVALAQ